jgi:excisionase family DNA binding protein
MDGTTGQGSKRFLNVKEAAEWLGLARSAIYAMVAAGQLACYRIGPNGGRLKFKPSDLDAYVESTRVGPKLKTPSVSSRPKYVPKYPL